MPLVSGTITVSATKTSGKADVYLLDANKQLLKASGTSAISVSLTYEVEAGQLYYVRSRAASGNGYITVTVTGEAPADGGVAVRTLAKELLQIVAKDSFGNDLDVSIVLKSGTFAVGETVVYTVTATDALGNTCTIDTAPILVTA